MIKGAIFDLDGTLINSLTFWEFYWPKFGKRFLNDVNYKPTLEEDKSSRTSMIEETGEYFSKKYGNFSVKEYVEFFLIQMQWYYENVVELKDGVYEFLEFLNSKGVKMIIATATPPKMLEIILKKTKIDKFFPITVSCNDVGVGKSKPDVFIYALSKINTKINETFVFEDSLVAIKSATSVNFKVIGIYDDNNFGQEEIKKLSSFYLDKGESFKKLIDYI